MADLALLAHAGHVIADTALFVVPLVTVGLAILISSRHNRDRD